MSTKRQRKKKVSRWRRKAKCGCVREQRPAVVRQSWSLSQTGSVPEGGRAVIKCLIMAEQRPACVAASRTDPPLHGHASQYRRVMRNNAPVAWLPSLCVCVWGVCQRVFVCVCVLLFWHRSLKTATCSLGLPVLVDFMRNENVPEAAESD